MFMLRVFLASTFGLLSGLGAAAAQDAAHRPAAAPIARPAPEAGLRQVSKNLVLVSTRFSTGYSGAFFDVGDPIDAQIKLKCPKKPAGSCVFEAAQNAQVFVTSGSVKYELCSFVDGNYMSEPDCGYEGVAVTEPTTANFVQTQGNIAPGKHKVQTTVSGDGGFNVGYYSFVYRVYKAQ